MHAGIAYNACMQYTLRNIPRALDRAIRQQARREGKSVNQVAIDGLLAAFGLAAEPVKRRDLSAVVGSWAKDPETDAALAEQRQVDPDLWR
jgi:hypothetical protein